MALKSSSVLLLDHHTDILIWEGRNVGENRDKWISIAQSLAEEKALDRFPRPYIMLFKVLLFYLYYNFVY